MPNILPELDPQAAYVYCPACAMNGQPKVMMKRENNIIKCPFNHQLEMAPKNAAEMAERSSMGIDMVQMGDHMKETPNIRAMKWPIWIVPEIRQKLEQKFPNNLWHTLETMLAALADGTLIFITGEEAMKLRKHGITNGATALAMAESMKESTKQMEDAVKKLDEFQAILKAAGIA